MSRARRHRIRKALDATTRTVPGIRWREDEALVEQVTHLTEWPGVLLGNFQPEYLSLPEEVWSRSCVTIRNTSHSRITSTPWRPIFSRF